MISMLEWLWPQLMETEVDQQLGAEKNARADSRNSYRSGYRPSPSGYPDGNYVRYGAQGPSWGYISFFITKRKRSKDALIQVVREALVQCVSTRKMEKLVRSLGIETL